MSIQDTLHLHYSPVFPSLLKRLDRSALNLRREVASRVSKWRTERVLSRLDRSILEDIGVPHDHVSPSAGPLERFPTVIRTNGSSILP
jgi:uncharacterized protein YjiS (DUF1127 family)